MKLTLYYKLCDFPPDIEGVPKLAPLKTVTVFTVPSLGMHDDRVVVYIKAGDSQSRSDLSFLDTIERVMSRMEFIGYKLIGKDWCENK